MARYFLALALVLAVALSAEASVSSRAERLLHGVGVLGQESDLLLQNDDCECADSNENECSCDEDQSANCPGPAQSFAPQSCSFKCTTQCKFSRTIDKPPELIPRRRLSRTCCNLCGGLCRQLCAKYNQYELCNGCIEGCLTRCELPDKKPANTGATGPSDTGRGGKFVPQSEGPTPTAQNTSGGHAELNKCMSPCAGSCRPQCEGDHEQCSGCVHKCFQGCAVELKMSEEELAKFL